ncbi:MAG TPA: TolC family protein [Polyangia bacterium]|nr:TolC family protein [Polyangia bacterium]
MHRRSRRAKGAATFVWALVPATLLSYCCLGSTPARGETVALDIDEAARRAAEASPVARRARAQRGSVEARRVEAGLLLPSNPVASFELGPTRTDGPPKREDLGVAARLEQTIEIAGQRGTRQAEVERAVDAAGARARLAEVEARARGRAAYVAAQLADAQLEAARRREALVTQLEASVRTRVSMGAASDIDLRLATLERGRIERERHEFVQAAGDALAELRALLALPPDATVTLTTALAAPARPLPTLADAIARAVERRADLQALDADRSELDASIVRLRREAVPSPTLFLDVERDRPGETFMRGGLALPLPVWRRQQGAIAIARAEQARVDVERTLATREVALQVDQALRAATTRGAQVAVNEAAILPSADEALDLLTQGWRAGKFDLFRIIQASRESGDAHRHALEDLGRLWEARIELDRAMGTP